MSFFVRREIMEFIISPYPPVTNFSCSSRISAAFVFSKYTLFCSQFELASLFRIQPDVLYGQRPFFPFNPIYLKSTRSIDLNLQHAAFKEDPPRSPPLFPPSPSWRLRNRDNNPLLGLLQTLLRLVRQDYSCFRIYSRGNLRHR